jgi:hypothetical protein
MGNRGCAACHAVLDSSDFSRTQWEKPVGASRCTGCVQNGLPVSTRESGTARRNDSSSASFPNDALANPFAQGAFRCVAKGSYTNGPRAGQACVCKWFKTGHVMEAEFFDLDIKAMNKALDLVQQWNGHQFINLLIKVNLPAVWTFSPGGRWEGKKVLQEPFIGSCQKFNCRLEHALASGHASAKPLFVSRLGRPVCSL